MSPFTEPISEHIWNSKYRYRWQGEFVEHSIEETWQRVAQNVARAEKSAQRKQWQQQFYDLLADFKFLPGGRILAGAGTKHKVTLYNCFVMGTVEDSLSGIFNALKEAALTLQQGGGIGYDFSTLRPSGLETTQTGSIASGPVSFMRIWDSMCATMQSTGARRGAMMGTLRCDHPDIDKFIEAKADSTQLRHFNVSVLVTDAFIDAVQRNKPWDLVFPIDGKPKVFKQISAKELWNKIIRSAYECAEPGVLFIDTINRMNNLWYREEICTTNPCGEIPLPPYGACNLGAINLTQFVLNPFSDKAELNWRALEETVSIGMRFLDNIIDVSRYPLRKQKEEALATRRVGLGLTGLADAFVMLGIRYGSDESIKLAEKIMQVISYSSWQASIELAKEKTAFPSYKKTNYLKGTFVEGLPDNITQHIARYAIRNSHHNTIAPTGTISLLANNISSGLEPIFDAQYKRQVRTATGELKTFDVADYAFQQWQERHSKTERPAAWVDAQNLHPDDHLRIQTAIQPYIDNAISKTIYIPEDYPFVQLKAVYTQAYEQGLKGCTIFRPNPVTGSVLTTESVADRGTHCCTFGD